VEELLHLLSNLFPTRLVGSSGTQKVFPYHKSVLDWLTDASAGGGCIDVSLGHAIIATTCFDSILAAAAARNTNGTGHSADRTIEAGSAGDAIIAYALHYGVAHLCTARHTAILEALVLDFCYFWPSAYAAGGSVLRLLGVLLDHASMDKRQDVFTNSVSYFHSWP